MMMLLAGCSDPEERKLKEVNERLMTEAKLYILDNKIAEMDDGELRDYTSTIGMLKSNAEYATHEYEKEMYSRLAVLLEQDDLQGVKKFYVGLGGELEDEPINESIATTSTDSNLRSNITSLYTASLYINATFQFEDGDRDRVSDAIKETRMLKSEEARNKFDELAEFIKDDKKNEAEQLYKALLNEYVPQDRMNLYNKLDDYTDVESLNEAISEIVK